MELKKNGFLISLILIGVINPNYTKKGVT